PKIADYPFTTVKPVLGVVRFGDFNSFTVADIPGLIEGASRGAGMGIKFLRHIERTRLFLHLIDCGDPAHPDPWESYKKINQELWSYSPSFKKKTQWVVFTKIDLVLEAKTREKFREPFEKKGFRIFMISSATGEGLDELIRAVGAELERERHETQAEG
ncbi:MAG: GTPase, partial [bacterium]|nr:GTPase [bacterium]